MADPFDELADGLADDRGVGMFGAWLQALEAAADEDDLFTLLAAQRPPESRLARQQLRGRLVKLLKERFETFESGASAAKTADAWLREGDEERELQGREFAAEDVKPWASPVTGADALDGACTAA